jgi:hypothetical protein
MATTTYAHTITPQQMHALFVENGAHFTAPNGWEGWNWDGYTCKRDKCGALSFWFPDGYVAKVHHCYEALAQI